MSEHDNPETDETSGLQETAHVEIYVDQEDGDVHVCRKCNVIFYDVQKYLEHKVKHDNFKVQFKRSTVDKRMVMPRLVQKQQRRGRGKATEEENPDTKVILDTGGKENEEEKKKGRRKQLDTLIQAVEVAERAGYTCSKCGRKFNREASLKRHLEYDHQEDSGGEGEDMAVDEDSDQEYRPSPQAIKEEVLDDAAEEAEMEQDTQDLQESDSLDQVIKAAAMIDGANIVTQEDGSQVPAEGEPGSAQRTASVARRGRVRGVVIAGRPSPQQLASIGRKVGRPKLTDNERMDRKYACSICEHRFRELAVLKSHMLTHTNLRQYKCTFPHCVYAFKTKGSLKRHVRRHTGERPYGCEMCGRSFSESGALTRHMKSRNSCANKTDEDLPRYGTKWQYIPNIPAVQGAVSSAHGIQGAVFSIPAEQGAVSNSAASQEGVFSLSVEEGEVPGIPAVSEVVSSTSALPSVPGVVNKKPVTKNRRPLVTVVEKPSVEEEESSIKVVQLQPGENGQICMFRTIKQGSKPSDAVEDHDLSDSELFENDGSVEVVIPAEDDEMTTVDSIHEYVQSETVIHEQELVTCNVCETGFQSYETLRLHLHTHLADQTSRCLLCHFVSTSESKEELESHMFLHHNVQLKCIDSYTTLGTPAAVSSNTESPTDLAATQRAAQLAVKQLMELPDSTESGEGDSTSALYRCPVCNKHFRDSGYLKLHMRKHTGLRPHKCQDCDKSFITKDTLIKHQACHEEDRNFKCGRCGKMFKRIGHVREHIRSHSASRPFSCTICEKTFKTNNAMKVHLRTHTDILPYECTFCHRRFREKGSLVRHTRSHTGEKPFECQHCGRKFAEHGTLNRHLKAKVSCNKAAEAGDALLEETMEVSDLQTPTDYTVLAEFSSVVADTQQYIVPEDGKHEDQTEYVVVQEGSHGDVVEVVTDGEVGDKSAIQLEGLQISDDYIIVNDPDAGCIRIMDSKTGEMMAILPSESSDNEIQTITMGNDVEVVTLMSDDVGDAAQGETVNTLLEVSEVGDGVTQAGNQLEILEVPGTGELHVIEEGETGNQLVATHIAEQLDGTQLLTDQNTGEVHGDKVLIVDDISNS